MKKKLLFMGLALVIVLVGVLGCSSGSVDQEDNASHTVSATNPAVGAPSADGLAQVFSSVLPTGNSTQNVGIWVSGEGKVIVTPDLVILTLDIESQEDTVAEAQRKAIEAMDGIMRVLENMGIDEKDVQTQYFSIRQVTRWLREEEKEEVIGYRVTNTVTTKIRELDETGEIIDAVAAVAGDLTRINGISFTVEDPTPYYTQAREKAMEDAIAKAVQMARLAGINLGSPTYISAGNGYYPVPRAYAFDEKAMSGEMASTAISVGEMEIQTTVSMVFDIQ